MQTPRTEFAQALKAITTERGLDPEVIIDTIEQAIIAAYKRDARDKGEDVEENEFEVEINPVNGEAKIYSWPPDKPEKKEDITPPGFGRIAAQTAKQVIHQKIREAEKSSIMDEFSNRVGNLVSGVILRFDGPNVRVDLGRTEGIMPAEERTPNERLSANQRLTFLLKEIIETPRGKEVLLSRSDPEFVEKLFAREVPEIGSGSVEIKTLAREAGVRTKMTVFSNQAGVDPVGSCVGQKGVRVQAVTNELDGERVDIIPWSDDEEELVASALSPAEGIIVALDEKTKIAKVKAPDDQLSLAIGKDGQNVRLAAKLTGWKIEVEVDESAPKTRKDRDEEVVEEKVEKKEPKTKKSKSKKVETKSEEEEVKIKEEEKVEKKEEKKTAGKKESESVTKDTDDTKEDTKEPNESDDKGEK
jgi:N utilization substance protein A